MGKYKFVSLAYDLRLIISNPFIISLLIKLHYHLKELFVFDSIINNVENRREKREYEGGRPEEDRRDEVGKA